VQLNGGNLLVCLIFHSSNCLLSFINVGEAANKPTVQLRSLLSVQLIRSIGVSILIVFNTFILLAFLFSVMWILNV